MVERSAVNRVVRGSSPRWGAILVNQPIASFIFYESHRLVLGCYPFHQVGHTYFLPLSKQLP